MSQPWGTEGEPSRITASQIVVTPGGDVAEVVTDSRREAWARWHAASSGSWSEWWHIAGKPEAVALALYAAPGEAARSADAAAKSITQAVSAELDRRGVAAPDPDDGQDEDTGSTVDAALVAVARRAPDARSWFLLTVGGLSDITL